MTTLELKKRTKKTKEATKDELLENAKDTTEDIAAEVVANITKMEISEEDDNTICVESAYTESSDKENDTPEEIKPKEYDFVPMSSESEEKKDEVAKAFESVEFDFTKDLGPTPMYIFDGWYARILKSTPEELLPELKEFKQNFRDFVNRTWQVLTKPIIDDINSLLDDIPGCKIPEDVPDGIWKLKVAFSVIQKDMIIAEKGFYRIRDFIENLDTLPENLVPKKLAREKSIKNAVITKFIDFCVLMKTIRRRTLSETIKLAVPYGVNSENFVFTNSLCRYYLLQDFQRVFIYKDDDPEEYSIDYSIYDAISEEDIILEMLDDIPEEDPNEYPLEKIFRKTRSSASDDEAPEDTERTADFEWHDDDKYDKIWKGFLDSGDDSTLTFRKNKHRKMLLKMAKEVNRIAKEYGVESFMIIADEHAFTCNANRNKYTRKALKNFIKEHNNS